MSLPTAIYRGLFAKVASAHNWDPRLLEAQVMVESSGNTKAMKTELQIQDASRGLMQVLYKTAHSLGLPDGHADDLFDPYVGVEYGLRALVDIAKWSHFSPEWAQGKWKLVSLPLPTNLRIVLARYNGGAHGNPREDGTLRNESYVERIELFFEAVTKETA